MADVGKAACGGVPERGIYGGIGTETELIPESGMVCGMLIVSIKIPVLPDFRNIYLNVRLQNLRG